MSTSTHKPVSVQIPPQGSDRPSWVKVGVIAVVGFAVGVAWPRLAGIRPGPSAPSDATAAATVTGTRATDAPPASAVVPAASAQAQGAAPVASAQASGAAGAAAPSASAPANAPPAVLVTRGAVVSCKTQEGESLKGSACGGLPQFDGLAQPRLKRLAQCPVAGGASGKLAVVFSLDFVRNKINFSFGKSSTVENKDSLDQCLRGAFDKVSLNAVDHEQSLYAMFYSVTFTPRDAASAPVPLANANATGGNAQPVATPLPNANANAAPPPSAQESSAQVAWEVAIVRDTPRTGNVIARLQRGTKVRVGAGQEGWYKVQYGANFASEGWVYRGSIGK